MKEYHKINSLYKRDEKGKMLFGEFSIPEFEYLKDNIWEFTEKVDGTNIRIMYNHKIWFNGKTDNAQMPSFLVNKLNERFKVEDYKKFEEKFGIDTQVCLYGEGYGAKIQKGGGNYRADQDVVLFDVKVGDWWLKREDVEDIGKYFDIPVVPIIGGGNLLELTEIVKYGFNSRWGGFAAEGIVARPLVPLFTRNGERLITKLKHKDFKQ